MEMMHILNTPLGKLYLIAGPDAVTQITFSDPGLPQQPTPLLRSAAAQLEGYFAKRRTAFDFPMAPKGTQFQQAVWREMARIPYGETRTYGQLAAAVGRPNAARAIGGACHANPLLIALPCHRVLGANGSLTGFGAGLERKRALLELEQG